MSLLTSEEELLRRKNEADIVYHRIGKRGNTTNHSNAGRKEGDTNIIPFVRELIAAEALDPLNKATATEIAEAWDVSASSVNNYKNGKHTGTDAKNLHSDIVSNADKLIKSKKNHIVSSLTDKLIDAMEGMNSTAIASEKPLIQTQIMRNIASTIEKVEGRTKSDDEVNGNGGDIHYHVHIPVPIDLKSFEVVDVDEKPLK
jgi:predicted transcriptional regulator